VTIPQSAPPRGSGAPRQTGVSGGFSVTGRGNRGYQPDVSTPTIPIILIAGCALISMALTGRAFMDHAGSTDSVSMLAFGSWIVGSFLGLIAFTFFRSKDLSCQAEPRYVEPSWRPRLVAVLVACMGWFSGLVGAFFVAQALARR